MEQLISSITSVLSSLLLGQDYEIFKSTVERIKRQKEFQSNPEALTLKANELTDSLRKSAELMAEIEVEFSKQKDVAMKLKEEAETNQLIASLKREDVEAVNKILSATVKTEGKKSNRFCFITSAFFCAVGIIVGAIIQNFTGFIK